MDLLIQTARLVAPGGRIVFCTCSLEPEEGPALVDAFLREHPDFRREPIVAVEIGGLTSAISATGDLRTLPFHGVAGAHDEISRTGMDGFFAARLQRAG